VVLLLALSGTSTLAGRSEADPGFATLAAGAAAARESNRLDEAMELYRKALALRPEWAEGWWSIGTLLYDRDAYREAVEAFQKAVALSPRSGIAAAMLGLSEARIGRDQDALHHLESARMLGVSDDPGLRQTILYVQGTLYLAAGEFGRAQETLDLLAQKIADREELIMALGESVLGTLPASVASTDVATREVIRRAGHAEYQAARRDTAAALREYTALAADAPKFRNVHFALGRFLVVAHQDSAAVEAFRREIEVSPDHLLARLGIAGVLVATDPATALRYAEEAIRLKPKLGEAHYLAGMALLKADRVKRAIVELETAQGLAPDDAKIYLALGNAYGLVERNQDAARARARFAKLMAESPAAEGQGPNP
jgi:tetratricopeptide (TPR) repeat protein